MTTDDIPATAEKHPNGAGEDDLAPYRAMTREELELHAFAADGRLRAVTETVAHWRGSEERTAGQGYIAPFRYSLAELAVTIRNAIFWANWPATEHLDIFADDEDYDGAFNAGLGRAARIVREGS